jgi:hypothetical protein
MSMKESAEAFRSKELHGGAPGQLATLLIPTYSMSAHGTDIGCPIWGGCDWRSAPLHCDRPRLLEQQWWWSMPQRPQASPAEPRHCDNGCVQGLLLQCTQSPCSLGLSATSQQYFSLTTNQPPATSQQYFSLRTNQHQPSATRVADLPAMALLLCRYVWHLLIWLLKAPQKF